MPKFFFILCCCLPFLGAAQPKGFGMIAQPEEFKKSLQAANASKSTIKSDFVQTKHLSLLEDKISSKGKFFFKQQNKVRIEYTEPYTYLLVMNEGAILVKDDQKTNRINTKNSKMMQSVNRIIVDCMSGNVFSNPDFSVEGYENGRQYLLSLSPTNEAMKQIFVRIDVYMDKNRLDVVRLKMVEPGGDFTDMEFQQIQHNIALDESLFKTR